jgi:NHLM bacteriocin system ABC transporter peptidase/ATP-binding protein
MNTKSIAPEIGPNIHLWSEKRVKTPTVLQLEAVECGAAALAMVLAYHGLIVPLEELRVECGISRDGSKASNIILAAQKYGLEARGFTKEPEDLKRLPLPMIVFWNFNHFVVFEGSKRGRVWINDPAVGPLVVTDEEFDRSFTGVVLTFEPGPGFRRGGQKRSLIASLRGRLAGLEKALVFVVATGLLLVVPALLIPTFARVFVDGILINRLDGWLGPLLLAMSATAVLRGGLTWLQRSHLVRIELKMAVTGSARFFRHVLRLPMEFFSQRMSGEIGSRVILNDRVADLLSRKLAVTLLNLVMIIFYAVVMVRYDIVLTLIGIGTTVLNLLVLKFVSEKRRVMSRRLRQEDGKLIGLSMSGLQMIETIKAGGLEGEFFEQWAGHHAKVVNVRQQLSIPSHLVQTVPVFLAAIIHAAILMVGGLRVMEGHLTIGMLVAFQSLMISFMVPVNRMVSMGARFQEASAEMYRLDDVLMHRIDNRFFDDRFSDETESAAPHPYSAKLSGELELRGVTFGYNHLAPPLIRDFNLHVKPGARVAIVGLSGSGKSTVAKLIAGLYEPWEGMILFDGKPRSELPRTLLANSVSMVNQEIFLFEDSVRNNLSMWDESVPEIEISEAAGDACIHDDIEVRPGAYQSKIGEAGRNYSGGQRQRLEIARALVNNPTLLILDEATSALDPPTEKLVDDNLRKRGCTCLIMAHRLSTIRDCDEIIVLDRGVIVQRGTHEQLWDAGGLYAEMIRMQ